MEGAPEDRAERSARGGHQRGRRRREALIRAGADLLAEQGWSALTSRAVAKRAEAPPGLVHYHFGGQAALKRAVATAVVAEAFEPALAILTSRENWDAGIAAVASAGEQMTTAQARVSAELIAASLHDDEVAAVLRQALGDARARLRPWLRTLGHAEPEGLATLTVALLDGLLLHRLIDPELRLDVVAAAAERDLGQARHT